MQRFIILIKNKTKHEKHYAFPQLFLRGHSYGPASLAGQERPQYPCAEPTTDVHGHAGGKDQYQDVDCRVHSSENYIIWKIAALGLCSCVWISLYNDRDNRKDNQRQRTDVQHQSGITWNLRTRWGNPQPYWAHRTAKMTRIVLKEIK